MKPQLTSMLIAGLLLVTGCGEKPGEERSLEPDRQPAPKPEVVSSRSTEPPPPVPAPGMAEGAGAPFKPGWSIALWNQEDNELVIGFLEAEPTAQALNTIKEKKSLFLGVFGVPMIEFGVKFEMKNDVPDIATPRYYRVVYSGFPGGGAVTFGDDVGSSRGWDMQVTGDPMSGGSVEGRFAGAEYWSWAPGAKKGNYYGWNFSFDLPVH
jgi:hypothetical protein